MNWLFPSMVATLTGTVALAAVYTYLAVTERHPFMKKWAMGWWIYALRFAFSLLLLIVPPYPLLLIGSHAANLVSGVFLLWGTYEFLDRKMPKCWIGVAGIFLVWVTAGCLLQFSFPVLAIPLFTFLGLIYIWTGVSLLKGFTRKWPGVYITGWAFIIWGIHKIDYPFLRPLEGVAPYGYLLASLLEIIIALGLLLIYFQNTKDELRLSLDSLKRSKDELDVLLKGTQAVLRETDFKSSARRIFDYCCQVTGATSGYVALLNRDGDENEVLFLESGGRPCSVDPRLDMPVRGFRAEAYKGGRALYHNDFAHSSWLQFMPGGHLPLDNVLFAPLIIESRVVGLLGIANKPGGFTDHDAKIAEAFGELVAIVLRNRQYMDNIKESEEKFARSFNNNPLIMTISDFDSEELREVNNKFVEITGISREEAIGGKTVDLGLITEDSRRKMTAAIRENGKAEGLELDSVNKHGETVVFKYFGDVIEYGGKPHLLSILQDITEERRAEEEHREIEQRLRQAQKMEAMGTLAGGIAHDFNNILGVIFGYTEMAMESAPSGAKYAEYLEKIRQAGERARELVRQILTFSRRSEVERQALQPRIVVKESLKMLRSSIPTTIEIRENIAGECGTVYADPTQFYQIIMNLTSNAYQAMEEEGGILTIELKNAGSIPEKLHVDLDPSARYVQLLVSDTGCGIHPDIIDKIFDPFFTTKGKNRGTGMGLATTYGIVKDYGGGIDVDSRPGRGTTFQVYLPRLDREAPPPPQEEGSHPGGDEHILFVDDEEVMTEMAENMLTKLGYRVTSEQDSHAALQTFSNNPGAFDLVITDQTMPGMTGLELAEEILGTRPDTPIILCSGYSSLVDEEVAKAKGVKEFVLKPLSKKDMAGLIRSVLDSSSAGNP